MTADHAAKLLIVDDEVAQMKALCNTLRDQGYATTGFSSARAALNAIGGTPFDLLLSDLMMPEMDGIALLQSALQKDPGLVGIIMTGEGTIATAVAAMKSGALDYILKPFKLSAILPVLERALSVRRLRLENARLERQVRERTIELESANQELESFSYSVSHDLSAPLRHIDGFADMLNQSKESSLSEKDRHYLQLIIASANKMSQLIKDLLEFSRMGRAEMRRTPIDLGGLVEKTIEGLQPEMEGRNIVWKKAQLPQVHADPALLQQVLSNLLFNAIKYSRPRNPAVIEIGCTEDEKETVIFVRDNGVGFDMEYADRLFGVFQRLHRKEDFEGTGIGLANVRRVIARHGGRTWAEGKVDAGATFYFSLPR
ncbi:MAG TPA: ATP-binding protein [Candidatus Methylacidiphilales bacterium]|nr:ATP-binding protein [Candidatus Methylacidiphilales bacterium]